MSDQRWPHARPIDPETTELLDLIEQYKAAVSALLLLEPGSAEHRAQLEAEMNLSAHIMAWRWSESSVDQEA